MSACACGVHAVKLQMNLLPCWDSCCECPCSDCVLCLSAPTLTVVLVECIQLFAPELFSAQMMDCYTRLGAAIMLRELLTGNQPDHGGSPRSEGALAGSLSHHMACMSFVAEGKPA